MSKNIKIKEDGTARNFSNVEKLQTNLLEGGTQNWVPEDEAAAYVDLSEKNITENGTYNAADDGHAGYSEVKVNVVPNLGTLSVTQNGTYDAEDEDYDGYSSVTVNVSGGGGGGSELITKTITENGTYDATDDGADGYSSVTVDVNTDSIKGYKLSGKAMENLDALDTIYVAEQYTNQAESVTVTSPTSGYQTSYMRRPMASSSGRYIYYNDWVNGMRPFVKDIETGSSFEFASSGYFSYLSNNYGVISNDLTFRIFELDSREYFSDEISYDEFIFDRKPFRFDSKRKIFYSISRYTRTKVAYRAINIRDKTVVTEEISRSGSTTDELCMNGNNTLFTLNNDHFISLTTNFELKEFVIDFTSSTFSVSYSGPQINDIYASYGTGVWFFNNFKFYYSLTDRTKIAYYDCSQKPYTLSSENINLPDTVYNLIVSPEASALFYYSTETDHPLKKYDFQTHATVAMMINGYPLSYGRNARNSGFMDNSSEYLCEYMTDSIDASANAYTSTVHLVDATRTFFGADNRIHGTSKLGYVPSAISNGQTGEAMILFD